MKKSFAGVWAIVLFSLLYAQEAPVTEQTATQDSEVTVASETTTVATEEAQTEASDPAPAENVATTSSSAESDSEEPTKIVQADVPPAKRPKSPDSKKVEAAEKKDTDKNTVKENKETLEFGIESDITSLLDKLTANDDPRFVEEVYDLFKVTKSKMVRQKTLAYFAKLEDPCLEDYAVTILNDPYDEPNALVNQVFKYVGAVKCTAALPAVMSLLENEAEDYFDGALSALGEIGGPEEAKIIAGYFDREDLSLNQRQTLIKVLGKIQAEDTVEELTELAQDTEESSFMRAYSAEAIGRIGKSESLSVLKELFEDTDPILRQYVILGLKNYKKDDVEDIMVQGIRDSNFRVRLEAIKAVDELKMQKAMPYLIYRAKKDTETSVKDAVYPVIARLNTSEGNDYLLSVITDKKISDNTKSKVAKALLDADLAGKKEILALAEEALKDDRRKPLRYALGKQFAQYDRSEYADICKLYLESKDTATVGTGLDIYAMGKYMGVTDKVKAIAEDDKAGANQKKAKRILGIEDKE